MIKISLICIPSLDDQGLKSSISAHFGKIPCFIIVEVYKGKIEDYTIKKNPAASLERKKGKETAKFLADKV